MSKQKKTDKKHFWLVVLALFLLIGSIAGGVYILNEQGLISVANGVQGDRSDGPPTDRSDSAEDGEMFSPSSHEGEGSGFNIQALGGVFKVLLQLSLVVVVITGGQRLFSWLQRRWRRAPAYPGS